MHVRDRILAAAAELYSTTGFRGATTRRIADRAGVNEVTLFRHFGSKTRLLHEAIKCAGLGTDLHALPQRPKDLRTDLTEWALANHRALYARRSLIRTAMGEIEERPEIMPPEESPSVCAAQALRAFLGRLGAAGLVREDVDPAAAATMFIGTLFADAMSRDILPQMYPDPPETSIAHYVDLFIRAIGAEERTA
jgi:AcrR family transcriptional regulator